MLLFLLAYLGGVLTILSPCILPVLPFVFARADQSFMRSRLPLLAGMVLTFAVFATLAAVGGGWVVKANEYGRWLAIALIVLFGLALIFPLRARHPAVRGVAVGYIELLRYTPLLVQIYLFYFGLPLVGLVLSGFACGVLALTLQHAAFFSVVFRGGIDSVPSGQWHAARSVGLRPHQIWLRVVLPQALSKVIPPLGNQFVLLAKDTSLLSAVGVADLDRVPLIVGVFQTRGATALVYRGDDGIDKLTTTGHSHVWEVTAGAVQEHDLDPAELGIARASIKDIVGGTPDENADVIRAVLAGERGPARDIILLNAAAGLAAYDLWRNPAERFVPLRERLANHLHVAEGVVDSGAAAAKLDAWVAATQHR